MVYNVVSRLIGGICMYNELTYKDKEIVSELEAQIDAIYAKHVKNMLKKYAHDDGRVSSNKTPKQYFNYIINKYGTWKAGLGALGFCSADNRKGHTKEEVIDKLVEQCGDATGIPVNSIRTHFGGLYKAREYAVEIGRAVPLGRSKLYEIMDKLTLNREFMKVLDNRKEITVKYLTKEHPKIMANVRHHYTQLDTFLTENIFNINYFEYRFQHLWTKEKIIHQFIYLINNGLPNGFAYLQKRHEQFHYAILREFGDYATLYNACGLDYQEYLFDMAIENGEKGRAFSIIGYRFEEIVLHILDDLKLHYEYQKEVGGYIPDFIIQNKYVVDAKLTYTRHSARTTYKKYSDLFGYEISIIYLNGDEVDERTHSTYPHRKIHVNKLIEQLPQPLQEGYYKEVGKMQEQCETYDEVAG